MALATHIPKEIDEYDAKIIGSLTGRQLIWGSVAIATGIAVYAILHVLLHWSAVEGSYVIMACAAVPGAIGFVQPEGKTLEQYLAIRLQHRKSAAPKHYQTKEAENYAIQAKRNGRGTDRAEAGAYYVGTRKTHRIARKAAKRHIRAAQKALRQSKRKTPRKVGA